MIRLLYQNIDRETNVLIKSFEEGGDYVVFLRLHIEQNRISDLKMRTFFKQRYPTMITHKIYRKHLHQATALHKAVKKLITVIEKLFNSNTQDLYQFIRASDERVEEESNQPAPIKQSPSHQRKKKEKLIPIDRVWRWATSDVKDVPKFKDKDKLGRIVMKYSGLSFAVLNRHRREHCPLVFPEIIAASSTKNRYYFIDPDGDYVLRVGLHFGTGESRQHEYGTVRIGVYLDKKRQRHMIYHCRFKKDEDQITAEQIYRRTFDRAERQLYVKLFRKENLRNKKKRGHFKFLEVDKDGIRRYSFKFFRHELSIHPLPRSEQN